MPMKGAKRHIRRLRKLSSPDSLRPVGKALFAAGEMIQVDAQLSITAGAVSGKNHVPSKPGEPPNADTHVLANNIETAQKGPLLVEVSSNAPYARIEWDWGNVAARPYMRPARDRNKAKVKRMVENALSVVVRKSRPASSE